MTISSLSTSFFSLFYEKAPSPKSSLKAAEKRSAKKATREQSKAISPRMKIAVATTMVAGVRGAFAMPETSERHVTKTITVFSHAFEPRMFNPGGCSTDYVVASAYQQCAADAAALGGRAAGLPVLSMSNTVRGGSMGLIQCSFLCTQIFKNFAGMPF